MYDILIIGGGTAGLTAAIHGAMANKNVLVLEQSIQGGEISSSSKLKGIIETKFSMNLFNNNSIDVKVASERATHIRAEGEKKLVICGESKYEGRSIIIATGVINQALGLDNEQRLMGRGIFHAMNNTAFFNGKIAAVAGEGSVALIHASQLAEHCQKVYIISAKGIVSDEQRTINLLKSKKNVKLILNSAITRLIGDKRLRVAEVTNTITGARTAFILDGLFLAVRQIPQTQMFSPPIVLDSRGYIISGEDCKTNIEGIFCAGSCRAHFLSATNDASKAVLSACKFIS